MCCRNEVNKIINQGALQKPDFISQATWARHFIVFSVRTIIIFFSEFPLFGLFCYMFSLRYYWQNVCLYKCLH